jgi:hypothetical protein
MAKVTQLTPEAIKAGLAALEAEYHVPPAEFFRRYQVGELGDSAAVMRGAWLCSMALQAGLLQAGSNARPTERGGSVQDTSPSGVPPRR